MSKHKRIGFRAGFTLVEMSLFLAVTGLLFMGIMLGTQTALRSQRFYDATQNFVEFLQSVYSQVSNPQSAGSGNSQDLAIYGKLVVFGESTGLNGNSVNSDGIQRVYVYDVVGRASGYMGTGDVVTALKGMEANVVVPVKNGNKITKLDYAGLVEDYLPRWDAQIETTAKGANRAPFKGSILIVRHPSSGTINTVVSSSVIEVNSKVIAANTAFSGGGNYNYSGILTDYLNISTFYAQEVDFCINPEGAANASDARRNVRLVKNARNSSGVELIDLDSADNRCRN